VALRSSRDLQARLRLAVSVIALATGLAVGARKTGPVPALGPFLDPAHGVWAMARGANLPANASGRIPALGAAVQVVYDDRAVPHIFAASERDAYRALGYVVARDRLFQMYLQTLAASGRLTEVAGARALPLDRQMRGLGLPAGAEAAAKREAGGPEFTQAADAYASGVNAFIDQIGPAELPLEFRLLGKRPERWSALDSYYLLGRMGYTLAYLDTESERYAAAARVGFAAADALFPSSATIQEPIQPTGKPSPRFDFRKIPAPGRPDSTAKILAAAYASFEGSRDEPSPTHASNNWAVAPKRSANGHALLAGDPHLDMTLPSIWYEAHIVVPGKMDVYGVTIPGAPFIVIGFNRDVAWSFTNTSVDVLDFYREQVDDAASPGHVMVDGAPERLTQRVEAYRDASGAVIAQDTIRFSHRGPLRKVGDQWLSMRWTVLEAGTEPKAFLAAQRAHGVAELQAAFGEWFRAPAQNFIAADRGGHISLRSTGRFPIRPGQRGDTIEDGRATRNDWGGDVPLEAYPQAFDPPQGFVASANQQPIDPSSSAYWWGGSFDPWRALRINELLRADSSVTVDEMRQFQTDAGSTRARLFMPRIVAAAQSVLRRSAKGPARDRLRTALELLMQWDGRYTKDNRRAVLFEQVMTELPGATWDELLDESGKQRVATPSSEILLELMSDSTSEWWDDRRTAARETRDDIVAAALSSALGHVIDRRGEPDNDAWRWDRVRFANIGHLLRLPALSASNIPVTGGPGTLAPSSGSGSHGPSWRMVVDLGPDIRAWATYPGGQSGNPFSDRYRDRIGEWSRGELEEVRFPRTADQLTKRSATLTLRAR
jgi:penicillin amidase